MNSVRLRRTSWLWAALLLLGDAAPAVAWQQPRDTLGLRPAFRLIDEFVARSMQQGNTPGLALALVDRAGLIMQRSYGYADLERRTPVTPETRFQIGSISKSFTAIALLQLADSGRFDPNLPVQRYLPWFTPGSRFRPITGHDLLTHTSGLPADRDDVPSSPAQAYAVRERSTGSAPGTVWAYSNIGYQVLGAVLEKLTGQSYPTVIQQRILTPLNLTSAEARFTNETRPKLANGYQSLYDDRPERASDPLVPAPWVEYASGDGSLVMNAADLGRYLEMLLKRGAGPRSRLLSDAGYERLSRPQAKTSDEAESYGYGLFLGQADGRQVFYHSGGMLGYSTYLIGEPTLGIGAVALINGPGQPGAVARFALNALGAAMRGDSLPQVPEWPSATHVTRPERYAGQFRSASGKTMTLRAAGDSLLLVRGDTLAALEQLEEGAFLGPSQGFGLFPIRVAGDSIGMTELWYGGDWYVTERYQGPRSFTTPAEWPAYVGHYRIMQPWEPNFRVVLRKGRLWLVTPGGDEEVLTPLGPREFRVGREGSAERVKFDDVVEGRALSATLSGMKYYRFFTP